MAYSAEKPHHHLSALLIPVGTTAAPPPTPSTQPNPSSNTTSASDFLSHLLRRLPPTLSLSSTTRRPSPLPSSAAAPLISLSDPKHSSALLSAATQLGFFQLDHHRIPGHLPVAAESAALSLLSLPRHQKKLLFPRNFPLGHDTEDDGSAEWFCLDSSCSAVPTVAELDFSSLREFSRKMEKLGLEVLDELACAAGFEKPARNELCSLMWISDGANEPGRVYPYVLGLQYQVRCQKLSLLPDSGLVTVSGQADSVFVTIGDILQVWSNGKMKKVMGMPYSSLNEDHNTDSSCITMSLLVTLPTESIVSPLIPNLVANEEIEECDSKKGDDREHRIFNSFTFEDYAWRVYHERMPLKDLLAKYRV